MRTLNDTELGLVSGGHDGEGLDGSKVLQEAVQAGAVTGGNIARVVKHPIPIVVGGGVAATAAAVNEIQHQIKHNREIQNAKKSSSNSGRIRGPGGGSSRGIVIFQR